MAPSGLTTRPASVADHVRAVDGVAKVGGQVLVNGVSIVDKDGQVLGTVGAPASWVGWVTSRLSGEPPIAPPLGLNLIALLNRLSKTRGS